MAFLNIDVRRFKYLLSLGADDTELGRFFKQSRMQLIMQGAKVQNLPHGPLARINALAQLPPAADKVIRQWFAKNVTMIDPDTSDTIVAAFEKYERSGDELSSELARRYSRSCLVQLFSDGPPDALLRFLRTPIGGDKDEQFEDADEDAIAAPAENYPSNLPMVLMDLIDGRDIQEHLDGFPPKLATFMNGLRAVSIGNTADATEAVEELSDAPKLQTSLEQFAQQREARKTARDQSSTGLEIIDLAEHRDIDDEDREAVLCYCTNDRPGATFLRPVAVVSGTQIERLTDQQRKDLFPDTGDVMFFAVPGGRKPPRRGQIGVWKIVEHPTDKQTHFHLEAEKRPVFEVRTAPFPSTDYDSIRDFLRTEAERGGAGWLQPSLFLLQDGVIVGGKIERPDLSKDQTFESGLVRWNSLPAFTFEGRLFVLGPLRKDDGIYECASLTFTVKKLFRGGPGTTDRLGRTLTKAQLRELASSLDDNSVGLDAFRVQRIRSELGRLADSQEALDVLVGALMDLDEVKGRIDRLADERSSAIVASNESLHDETKKLQRQRSELEGAVARQEKELSKLRDETNQTVRSAFEKARKAGLATLAETAIFQALSNSLSPDGPSDGIRATGSDPTTRPLVRTKDDPIALLRRFAIPSQRAAAVVTLADCAMKSGVMVGLSGIAARVVAELWSGTIGSGIVIDATVGLINDTTIREICDQSTSPDLVVLLDANLSALDIYARPLIDLVFSRVAGQGGTKPSVLFSLNTGVGSLPLPRGIERLSVVIDLDANRGSNDDSALDELKSRVLDPSTGSLYRELWHPAANRLRDAIQGLDQETQVRVLSILDEARPAHREGA